MLAEEFQEAQHVVVLTGAGVSAESGIPTFRGSTDSYWSQFDPMMLASVEGFRENPKLVWEWYAMRREKVLAAQPNPAHFALARLEGLVPRFTLITQNVDDLHERAGSQNPLHLHGSILVTRCSAEGRALDGADLLDDTVPPRCRRCGAYARPGVVWFGEMLPRDVWDAAERAVASADMLLIVGTSAVVHPAASLAASLPKIAPLVVVNPEETEHSRAADYFIQAPAGAALPALVEAAFGK